VEQTIRCAEEARASLCRRGKRQDQPPRDGATPARALMISSATLRGTLS
jgi:hypothetical protein